MHTMYGIVCMLSEDLQGGITIFSVNLLKYYLSNNKLFVLEIVKIITY